jgi:hypothetical protein
MNTDRSDLEFLRDALRDEPDPVNRWHLREMFRREFDPVHDPDYPPAGNQDLGGPFAAVGGRV